MRIIDRAAIEAQTVNPSPEALGFNLDTEMAKACRTALKPLEKRLREYRRERARLEANCDQWSDEAYKAKMDEIASRAHGGDQEAAAAIASGTIPSRESFRDMSARAHGELENFRFNNRTVFSEAAELIEAPMRAVVERGQAILDATLKGFGLPEYKLHGATNHVSFVVLQLQMAGRNEGSDLQWFWQVIG